MPIHETLIAPFSSTQLAAPFALAHQPGHWPHRLQPMAAGQSALGSSPRNIICVTRFCTPREPKNAQPRESRTRFRATGKNVRQNPTPRATAEGALPLGGGWSLSPSHPSRPGNRAAAPAATLSFRAHPKIQAPVFSPRRGYNNMWALMYCLYVLKL